jgi:hypothetical protein
MSNIKVANDEKKSTVVIQMRKELLSEGNKRDHWRIKYMREKQRKEYLFCYNVKLKNLISRLQFPFHVTLTRIAPKFLDYDNWVYTAKGFRDYIADLIIPGLAPGRADHDEKLIQWEYSQTKGNPNQYALMIELSSLDKCSSDT